MPRKKLSFQSESEEAAWWAGNQDVIAKEFEKASRRGALGRGTALRTAQEGVARSGPSPTITIRLPEEDLQNAKQLAAECGLRYQTYIKMLLHKALVAEEKRSKRAR